MARFLALLYGIVCYLLSQITILYVIVFLGYYIVPAAYRDKVYTVLPWSCDHVAIDRPGNAWAIDVGLLLLFGLQHTVMARPTFKRLWTRLVPQPIERSTYLLASCACLWLLFWQWRPIPEPIWPQEAWPMSLTNSTLRPVFQALFWLGWILVIYSARAVDELSLFGLRQTLAHFRGQEPPAAQFRTPGLYRYVRHPLMLGFLMATWAAPVMTLGRLLFAGGLTSYILVAVWFEERDLAQHFGEPYLTWKSRTSMLLPLRRPK